MNFFPSPCYVHGPLVKTHAKCTCGRNSTLSQALKPIFTEGNYGEQLELFPTSNGRKTFAVISFLTEEEGGRRTIPGSGYKPTVNTIDSKSGSPLGWSIVLDYLSVENQRTIIASVHFLSEKGPNYLLEGDFNLSLNEGGKLVARAMNISSAIKDLESQLSLLHFKKESLEKTLQRYKQYQNS
jgi:hypothetical protein